MRSREVHLQLLCEDGEVNGFVVFLASDDGRKVKLTCKDGLLAGHEYLGVDYFWTFGEMRNDLSSQGVIPMCEGARKDIFPGGLQGETSLGLIAYVFNAEGTSIGKVNIFEPVTLDDKRELVSFEEQKAHRKILAQKRRGRGGGSLTRA